MAPLDTAGQTEVRCDGCGSAWTDADLARERAANRGLLSCCPERKPLTIDQWRDRAIAAEAAISWALGEGDSDFGDNKPEDAKPFWWRTELRQRAGRARTVLSREKEA